MKNIFRTVQNFPGYEVSPTGIIVNLVTGRIVSERVENGYRHITLSRYGKAVHTTVHRIVAQTYINNPSNLPQVHHLDGNRLNCNVDNLMWVTSDENLSDPRRLKRHYNAMQRNNIKVVAVDPITGYWKMYVSISIAAKLNHGNGSSISRAIKTNKQDGTKRTYLGMFWYHYDDYFTILDFNKLNRGARS